MARYPTQRPPWEFLLKASKTSLQSFELSRLACAANLRKEISALLDQWLEESASAMLARLLLEQRESASQHTSHALAANGSSAVSQNGGQTASYNIFPEPNSSPPPSGASD